MHMYMHPEIIHYHENNIQLTKKEHSCDSENGLEVQLSRIFCLVTGIQPRGTVCWLEAKMKKMTIAGRKSIKWFVFHFSSQICILNTSPC